MLNGLSILILEDDRDTLEMFAASLSKLGADVKTAMSAEAALTILESWHPNAILCDLHLPHIDGYGFLERVRAIPSLADIPLIAISASHPELERERSLEAGFAGHLTKPSKLSEIIGAVTRIVAR